MGGKEVPTQNIGGTVSEISVTVDVCSATVKYYLLVRGTSEGDKSQSHISSHFAPIEERYTKVLVLCVKKKKRDLVFLRLCILFVY